MILIFHLRPRPLWALMLLLALTTPALAQSGSLAQWGNTSLGQLNNAPAASERFVAVAAGAYHNVALRADGSLVQWGATGNGQASNAPAASERFVAIAAGASHNVALRADGSLVQWGDTSGGQADNAPAASEQFVAIAAGAFHNLALRADGSLVQWGATSGDQLDNAPAASERFVAVSAGGFHSLALRAEGSLVQWGSTAGGQATGAPAASERFIAVSGGHNHSLALRADGSLVQWGSTGNGQLSNAPAASERFVAVSAGGFHSLALRADGSLVQWGAPTGQLSSAPAASERFVAISAGGNHSLALRGSPVASRLAFTYQGVLSGIPGGGAADLRFSLWTMPTDGQQRGEALTMTSVPLSPRGLFSAELDFGPLDPTASPWLQIEVAQPGSGSFTALSPRQRLGGTPMATLAGSAVTAAYADGAATAASVRWSGLTGVPAGFADGVDDAGDGRWADLPSGIGYTGPGGTTINGLRLTHGAEGSSWDLLVGGAANSFTGGFAIAEEGMAKMVVQATTGNVGIGTTGPTFKLDVAGSVRCTSLTQTSSARYKRDVAPVSGVLERFLRLRPVAFTWDQGHGGDHAVGLIAEEVGELFPECVSVVDGVTEGIDYAKLTALAVQAIKEQQQLAAAENDELRTRLERLERLLDDREPQADIVPQK